MTTWLSFGVTSTQRLDRSLPGASCFTIADKGAEISILPVDSILRPSYDQVQNVKRGDKAIRHLSNLTLGISNADVGALVRKMAARETGDRSSSAHRGCKLASRWPSAARSRSGHAEVCSDSLVAPEGHVAFLTIGASRDPKRGPGSRRGKSEDECATL